MARFEASIEDFSTRVATLPRSFWRRHGDTSLARLPGGIRLAVLTSPFIVRWAAWLVAMLIVFVSNLPGSNRHYEPYLVIGTLVQTILVTFYVPVIRPLLMPALRRWIARPENYDVPAMGLIDLVLSMVAVYLSGGWGSPYYHFAVTALLIPAFFLTFRGTIVLCTVYMIAYIFGLATFGDGVHGWWKDNAFIGAMMTPLLVALVPNYLGTVLRELDAARADAVEALADSELLHSVARAFLEGGGGLDVAASRVADAIVSTSRFDLVLLIVPEVLERDGETRGFGLDVEGLPPYGGLVDAFDADGARTYAADALPAPLDGAFDGCAWTRVVPLRSAQAVEGWIIAGTHERPAAILHEVRLLDAVAGQTALGLRNIRLMARIAELAAEGERGRIAREIHDGIAQMVYMLSLSLETAVDRVGSDPDEQRQRLQDLTALAKNALWEVRQYIFDLRPLLSGDEGLVGALQGQVKEFQAVSDMPVEVTVTGTPVRLPVETSAALYRIVQEGLGNVFRHARAASVGVDLAFVNGTVKLAITDDGIGIGEAEPGGRVGHGMANLRRRVEDLHGSIDVRSEAGAGTRIEVVVPTGGGE